MTTYRNYWKGVALSGAVIGVTLVAPAHAQDKDSAPPKAFSDAVACRDIADDTERLACYDTAMGALAKAQADKEIMVVTSEEVRETRRGLFGLKMPRLFGGDDGEEEISEITAKIAEVRGGRGSYTFVLDNEAVWTKTEDGFLRKPEVGQTIVIRKGALGSYFGRVEGGISFRIRRVN